MAGKGQPSRPAPSRASSPPTDTDIIVPKSYTIRPSEAKEKGYTYTTEPPAPTRCEFCGRELEHLGGIIPGKKQIMTWFSEPERCDCPQAQEYWRQRKEAQKAQEAAEARAKDQERIRRRIGKLMDDSGMGARFQSRTFQRFQITRDNEKAYNAAKRYADSFAVMLPTKDAQGRVKPPQKERNGLFISGTKGTGKTHLAAAIANQLIEGGTAVVCMTMIDLLSRIKQTFGNGDAASEADILSIYKDVPLLIVDDIGTEQPTDWGITKIYTIINARYEGYMPTIVTTNYSGDELIRRMTPPGDDGYTAAKTIDRLHEMCAGIEMTGESWRGR